MQLTEINNLFSDTLLAIFLIFWGLKIKAWELPNNFNKTWGIFFLLVGLSAFIGGWGHSLTYYFDKKLLLVSWTISIIAVLNLEIGHSQAWGLPSKWHGILYLKAILFAGLTIFYEDFQWVKMDMTLGIVGLVLPVLALFYKKTQQKGYSIILLGLLANGLSGAVHSLHLSLSTYFDHRDLAHLISIICFGIIFSGLKTLKQNTEIYKSSH